jgi:hypothetical protein
VTLAVDSPASRSATGKVLIAALIASLALSFLSAYYDDVIQHDGVLYIEAARAFSDSGITAAYPPYLWPFYSWLIALFHDASGFEFETSAHALNAVFFALLVVAFILLVKEAGGTGAVLIAAAIVVLAYPRLNGYRSFIVRDSGYWAFYLAGLLLFIRFFRQPNWRKGVAWVIAMLLATLFRLEGLVFLATLPLAFLFKPGCPFRSRLAELCRAYLPHTVLAAALLAIYWLAGIQHTGRLLELIAWGARMVELGAHLDAKASALTGAILNRWSDHMGMTALVFALFGILLVTVIKGVSLLYSALALHAGFAGGLNIERDALVVLVFAALLNLFILALFLSVNFFLTGRFVVAFALIVMIAVSFSLGALFQNWRKRRGWIFPAVCAVLAYMAVDGMVSLGPSNTYLKHAGLWLKDNAAAPATLYSDDSRVAYYARMDPGNGHWDETQRILGDGSWKNFDYLAIEINRRNRGWEGWIREKINISPVATFGNDRDDRVVIFKVTKERNE